MIQVTQNLSWTMLAEYSLELIWEVLLNVIYPKTLCRAKGWFVFTGNAGEQYQALVLYRHHFSQNKQHSSDLWSSSEGSVVRVSHLMLSMPSQGQTIRLTELLINLPIL